MEQRHSQAAEWKPDPFRRHQLRRFFLGIPTSVVLDGSMEGYDAVNPLVSEGPIHPRLVEVTRIGAPPTRSPLKEVPSKKPPVPPRLGARPPANDDRGDISSTTPERKQKQRRSRLWWKNFDDLHPSLAAGVGQRIRSESQISS